MIFCSILFIFYFFRWMFTVHRRDNRRKALEDEKNEKNEKNDKNEISEDKNVVTKDVTHVDETDKEIKVDTFKQMSMNETLDSEIP